MREDLDRGSQFSEGLRFLGTQELHLSQILMSRLRFKGTIVLVGTEKRIRSRGIQTSAVSQQRVGPVATQVSA